MRPRDKCYHCKDIVYDILPPKIVQLYCIPNLRKYKRERYENGTRHIRKENGIKLKNGFDIHRKFLEAIDYGWKFTKKIFPLNYFTGNGKIQEGYTEWEWRVQRTGLFRRE